MMNEPRSNSHYLRVSRQRGTSTAFCVGLLLPLIIVVALCFSAQAQAQRQIQKLPPGYYVYLGRQLGGTAPKYVVVKDDGSVHWERGSGAGVMQTPQPMPMATPRMMTPNAVLMHSSQAEVESSAPPGPPPNGEFETYEYPFIKWKAKLRPSGALMQLETRLETAGGHGGGGGGYGRAYGPLKYKLTVLIKGAALVPTQGVHIEFLDDKGFGLGKITVPASEFSPLTGTSILEARGTANISEDDYRRSVDWSVN